MSGEAPVAAARRELTEVLGIDARDLRVPLVVEHAYPDRAVRLHALIGRCPAVALVHHRGVTAHAWIEIVRLGAMRLPAASAPIVDALLTGLAAVDT